MSAATEIVAECARLGVRIEARADGLHLKPASAVPPKLKARILQAKPELLELLAAQSTDAPKATAKSDTGRLPAVLAVPSAEDPQDSALLSALPDIDDEGRPLHGCWNCRSREFARDLVDRGWVCARCHPPGDLRAHVERCTSRYPSRRGVA